MKLLLIIAFITAAVPPVSFYSLNLTSVNNTILTMNSYQNKKILLVNVASASPLAEQLRELEKFYQKHKDSVMVIAFPSNSFGNEPLTNQELKLFFNSDLKATYAVAIKSDVTGNSANTVYEWLASATANGVFTYIPKKDFEKVLLGKDGRIAGVFAADTRPMDERIKKALQRN